MNSGISKKSNYLENASKSHLFGSRESILSDDSEYYRVCPRVTSVHEFVVWWSGFDFFVISLPGVWLGSTFEHSTNQITWFQSSINVKFLKRETKSSSADCHDDDLFYIPMFYLPFFLIFRIMHPPVIYRDHKVIYYLNNSIASVVNIIAHHTSLELMN